MDKKKNTKELLTLAAAATALGLGVYYFFYASKKSSSRRKIPPIPQELMNISTTNKEEFQQTILKMRVKEVNGHLDHGFISDIHKNVLAFLMPFFEPACQTGRDTRRNYLNDMTKYVEVSLMYYKLFRQIFVIALRYALELLEVDLSFYDDSLRGDIENESLWAGLTYFPYFYDGLLRPKMKVDPSTYVDMGEDLLSIVEQQGKLIEDNLRLFDVANIPGFLFIRVYDTVYERYGYELEDFIPIFGGLRVIIKGVDPKCIELRDKFSTGIVKKVNYLQNKVSRQ